MIERPTSQQLIAHLKVHASATLDKARAEDAEHAILTLVEMFLLVRDEAQREVLNTLRDAYAERRVH